MSRLLELRVARKKETFDLAVFKLIENAGLQKHFFLYCFFGERILEAMNSANGE